MFPPFFLRHSTTDYQFAGQRLWITGSSVDYMTNISCYQSRADYFFFAEHSLKNISPCTGDGSSGIDR